MHEEHRNRLRKKALENISSLNEFELLELILFSAKPRVNTNDTAHFLLEKFGDIKGVFSASPNDLIKVEGVGKNTAAFIAVLGKIISNYSGNKPCDEPFAIFSLETIREPLTEFFKSYKNEVFIIYFLSKNREIIGKHIVGSHLRDRIVLDLEELSRQTVLHNPAYAVIAHNHLSGDPHPSNEDLKTTEKICFLLAMNNVKLLDHIIVSGNNYFSFFHEGTLDEITFRVDRMLDDK